MALALVVCVGAFSGCETTRFESAYHHDTPKPPQPPDNRDFGEKLGDFALLPFMAALAGIAQNGAHYSFSP